MGNNDELPLSSLMQSLKKILLSPKLVVTLIALVALSCLIAVTVPQGSDHPPQYFQNWKNKSPLLYNLAETLQLTNVYMSVWFLALVSLITLSLSLTVYDQGRTAAKTYKIRIRPPSPDTFKAFWEVVIPKATETPDIEKQAVKVFREHGFRVAQIVKDNGVRIVAVRHRMGRWGNFILHAGLLCIIFAALYNLLLQQRGFFQLMEKETFSGRNADWLQSTSSFLKRDFNLDFQVHLKGFTPEYWDNNKIKSLRSNLVLIDEKGNRDVSLEITSPVRHKGVTIFQSNHYGYVVIFILTPRSGEPVMTQFCLDRTGRRPAPFAGKADFPTTDYILRMKFYPDAVEPASGKPVPAIDLRVSKQNTPVFSGRVLYGRQIRIGDDTLHFADFSYWSGLTFVKNSGADLVYLGFAIAVLGGFLIYFLVPQEIHAEIVDQDGVVQIKMGGYSRRYPALFQEKFSGICSSIRNELSSG